MTSLTLLLAICTLTSALPKSQPKSDGCHLDVVLNALQAPLVVNSSFQFPTPTSPDTTKVYFAQGEIFYIACPGGSFNYPLVSDGEPALCHGDTIISTMTSNQVVDFADLTCDLDPSIRPYLFEVVTEDPCEYGRKIQPIGYSVDDKWVETYHVCFDPTEKSVLYSKYITNRWMNGLTAYDTNLQKVWSGIFDIDLFSIYQNVRQIVEGLGIVGYITDDVYLTEGYLAPYTNFLSPFQKDTTFDMANAPLRWNTISNGNWEAMEASLNWVITEGNDFGEVTMLGGALGVASLPDENGISIDLYLDSESTFPVPRWFWKLMHSPSTQSGVLFFVWNNPYVAKPVVDKEFINSICTQDVLPNVNWITGLDTINPFAGFIYACPVGSSYIINPTMYEVVHNLLTKSGTKGEVLKTPSSLVVPPVDVKKIVKRPISVQDDGKHVPHIFNVTKHN